MKCRYGPWIDHDGKGYPEEILEAGHSKGARDLELYFSKESGARRLTPWEQANPPKVDKFSPAWSWRWKGEIFTKRLRVCTDPEYQPIIKYRLIYEDPPAVSEQVEMLREIASGKREPAPEPMSKAAVRDD